MNNFKIFIEKLSAERITKYLQLNGWKQQGCVYDDKVLQFVTSDETESLLLPVDKSFMDYDLALYLYWHKSIITRYKITLVYPKFQISIVIFFLNTLLIDSSLYPKQIVFYLPPFD